MTVAFLSLLLLLPQDDRDATVVNAATAARSTLAIVALPFARGELPVDAAASQVTVATADSTDWPARIAFRWSDGSIGLLHAHASVTVKALADAQLHLAPRRDEAGKAVPHVAPLHRPRLQDPLPLYTELVDPWGRTLIAALEPDPAAGPSGILWDTGRMRVRRFVSRHCLPAADGGAPFLGLRAFLVTVHGSRTAQLTLLLDNSDLALGPVRFSSFALVTTDDSLRFLPAFAAEQGLPPPVECNGSGFRQWLLRPADFHYLGDGTAKAFRIHLFQEGPDVTDAEREAASLVDQPLAVLPSLARVRETSAFGAHGGPAPVAESDPGSAGSQYMAWRRTARFGPYGGFGDPENAAVQGTARNGPCALHNLLRWKSPHLWLCAEGMVLQQTLRPTPGRNPAQPQDLAAYRQGLGPLAQHAPHGFTRPDYEHFSVALLYDWWWLTGDVLAHEELARMGRGLRAELAAVPFLTSRGEGWCLQSGVLIARATGDAALLEWLRQRVTSVVVPALGTGGLAIAQPPHDDALGTDAFDAPWQMAALIHGLHALWRACNDAQVQEALLRTADAMVGPGWIEGRGPKYFVSAKDANRYTTAGDAMVQEGVALMVAAGLALAMDSRPEPARHLRYQMCLDHLLARLLPPDATPSQQAAAAANPWLQVVYGPPPVTVAIVYGLAVADGLSPVAGAAPFDVLARQLPRFLVARLNGERDRGVRFLPFLGNVDGRRCFLRVRELLPPETLLTMHRQGAVTCVVDGRIHDAGLRLRILGGPGLVHFEGDLPFDPKAPLDVLPRAEFEVMTALGWHGPPAGVRTHAGEALAWLLVAKDALLALEAGLQMGSDFEPLRAARRCAELLPQDGEAQRLVLDISGHVLKAGIDRDGAVELLAASAPGCRDPEHLERIASLLDAADARPQAAAVVLDVARRWPARTAAVNSAASELFREGRLDEALVLLRGAVAAGNSEVTVLARLCGIADLLGQKDERDRLCERILAAGEPPPTVVRLLVTFLMEQERMSEALALVSGTLQREIADAALWLEQARLLLLLGRGNEAVPALERAVTLDPDGEAGRDSKRLLRVAQQEGLLPELRRVEQLLRKGELRSALTACRALCRARPQAGEAWLLLGIVRQKLGQLRRAEKALRSAVELEPGLGDAHNRLGILLVARGRHAAGHAHLLQAKALQPWESSVHLHLAQASALLGRRDEGEQHLAEAGRLGADAATLAAVRRGFFAAGA